MSPSILLTQMNKKYYDYLDHLNSAGEGNNRHHGREKGNLENGFNFFPDYIVVGKLVGDLF